MNVSNANILFYSSWTFAFGIHAFYEFMVFQAILWMSTCADCRLSPIYAQQIKHFKMLRWRWSERVQSTHKTSLESRGHRNDVRRTRKRKLISFLVCFWVQMSVVSTPERIELYIEFHWSNAGKNGSQELCFFLFFLVELKNWNEKCDRTDGNRAPLRM